MLSGHTGFEEDSMSAMKKAGLVGAIAFVVGAIVGIFYKKKNGDDQTPPPAEPPVGGAQA
jgi:hypothetical protein